LVRTGRVKTNLVSFFEMLKASLGAKLDDYVGRHGGPNAFLYLGAKTTSEIAIAIIAHTEAGDGTLYQRLVSRPGYARLRGQSGPTTEECRSVGRSDHR